MRAVAACALALALAACGGGAAGIYPHVLADSRPVPTNCPSKICDHSSSSSPTPSEEPTPSESPGGGGGTGGGASPTPQQTSAAGGAASPVASPKPGTLPSPKPSAAPVADGVRLTAHALPPFPYDQPFPLDPPPPPPPLTQSLPWVLAALAALLAVADAAALGKFGLGRARAVALRR